MKRHHDIAPNPYGMDGFPRVRGRENLKGQFAAGFLRKIDKFKAASR
jgi:hypothetical protein